MAASAELDGFLDSIIGLEGAVPRAKAKNAMRELVERASAEKAQRSKETEEAAESTRRAEAEDAAAHKGLLLPMQVADAAGPGLLERAVEWCDKEGANGVEDIIEAGLVVEFCEALDIPARRDRKRLERVLLGGHVGRRLVGTGNACGLRLWCPFGQ